MKKVTAELKSKEEQYNQVCIELNDTANDKEKYQTYSKKEFDLNKTLKKELKEKVDKMNKVINECNYFKKVSSEFADEKTMLHQTIDAGVSKINQLTELNEKTRRDYASLWDTC